MGLVVNKFVVNKEVSQLSSGRRNYITFLLLLSILALLTPTKKLMRTTYSYIDINVGQRHVKKVKITASLNRIAPLDPKNKFSFVHISKCAGSTWIRIYQDSFEANYLPRLGGWR